MSRLSPCIKYLLFLSIIGLASCVPTHPQLAGSPRRIEPLRPLEPRPGFILDVEPDESSITDFKRYRDESHFNNEICVEVDLWHIVQAGDDLPDDGFVSRSTLLVNEQKVILESALMVATLTRFEIDGQETSISGPVTLCWKAELTPGLHAAHLAIKQTDGNVLSYRWNFMISK